MTGHARVGAALAALAAIASGTGATGVQPRASGAMRAMLVRAGVVSAGAEESPPKPVELVTARQDWKRLTPDRACHTLTPLCIGGKRYPHGLGAHANGEAVFALHAPFARFVADVGIDDNDDTAGSRGSAVFVVRVDGREVARTPVRRGGQPPRTVDVSVRGASRLELIVLDAGDGYSYDQADWAGARLVDARGRAARLSDALPRTVGALFAPQSRLPASFDYGGEPSESLLAEWPRETKPAVARPGSTVHEVVWREPGQGLEATWRAEVFDDADAVEVRWTFRNAGQGPSKTLTDVRALDLQTDVPAGAAHLVRSTGGLIGGLRDADLGFDVTTVPLTAPAMLSGAGGRSSNRDLPFFLVNAEDAAGGMYVGVGWSGQWQADLASASSGAPLRVAVTVPGTAVALPPGETLLTPSVLIGVYGGDALDGGNALRRALRRHYVPTLGARKPLPPVSWSSWFTLGNGIDEALLKRQADVAASLGVEWFCIDSGWFEGEFPNGVGNWTIDRAKFPHGLGPIGRYVRERGMHLGLWFEPERVAPGTRLAREHPEWVRGDLLDLGNRGAREWVYGMMARFIDEGGVRWIRFDFNTDPLPAWDSMDAPATRGLAQARHIAGLYELLDRLRAAYPDLLIEGCASGGRRIDLETVRRSHTFWKSDDTGRLPVMRFHETGGNRFLPGGLLNANLLSPPTTFDVLGLFGGPLGFGQDLTKLTAAEVVRARALVDLYKDIRPFLDADFYPLIAASRAEDTWVGWQFHDPTADQGVVIALRPAASPYAAANLRLRGLGDDTRYVLNRQGVCGSTTSTGAALSAGWRLELPAPGTATLVRYARAPKLRAPRRKP